MFNVYQATFAVQKASPVFSFLEQEQRVKDLTWPLRDPLLSKMVSNGVWGHSPLDKDPSVILLQKAVAGHNVPLPEPSTECCLANTSTFVTSGSTLCYVALEFSPSNHPALFIPSRTPTLSFSEQAKLRIFILPNLSVLHLRQHLSPLPSWLLDQW